MRTLVQPAIIGKSISAKEGPYQLAKKDRGGPYPLAKMDRGSNIDQKKVSATVTLTLVMLLSLKTMKRTIPPIQFHRRPDLDEPLWQQGPYKSNRRV